MYSLVYDMYRYEFADPGSTTRFPNPEEIGKVIETYFQGSSAFMYYIHGSQSDMFNMTAQAGEHGRTFDDYSKDVLLNDFPIEGDISLFHEKEHEYFYSVKL